MIGISADEDDDAEGAMARKEVKKEIKQENKTPQPADPKVHWCEQHQVFFRKFEKDGKTWYSHKDGDKWCNEQKTGEKSGDTQSITPEEKTPPAQPQDATGTKSDKSTTGKLTPEQTNTLQDYKKAGKNLKTKIEEYGWQVSKLSDLTEDQANRLIEDLKGD